MTPAELIALKDPSKLSPEAQALWQIKNGDWDSAHNIAQDIHRSDRGFTRFCM
jgi:hypothetical protein